jgi:valyl-tRNA synthetase
LTIDSRRNDRESRRKYSRSKKKWPDSAKLLNPDFLANAPEQVVKLNQSRLVEFQEKLSKLSENLNRL